MPHEEFTDEYIEHVWRTYMTTGQPPPEAHPRWFEATTIRKIARALPKEPRCRACYYPFEGLGGQITKRLLGIERSRLSPHLCNVCERFATEYAGGAEIEMSIMFADIRGSTALAEDMRPAEYSAIIQRFYRATTGAIFKHNGMVEKLIGDEVTGLFVPGFAGPDHPAVAVDAARAILAATGHEDPDGPWVPVGVGIHTGVAYLGTVKSEGGIVDIAALGDTPNTAARLSSLAGAGEVLISDATREGAGLDVTGLREQKLELKGRSEPLDAWTIAL